MIKPLLLGGRRRGFEIKFVEDSLFVKIVKMINLASPIVPNISSDQISLVIKWYVDEAKVKESPRRSETLVRIYTSEKTFNLIVSLKAINIMAVNTYLKVGEVAYLSKVTI